MLNINTVAPDFSLLDQDDNLQTLSQRHGRWVVLYFYPKDDTPGCTKEACAIAEVYEEFSKLGVEVFGVSMDSPASHAKFASKYNLPFRLLSDTEGKVIESYEARKDRMMFGKTALSIARVTYLVSPAGTIAKVYPQVDPASHALEIIADLKKLV